MKLDVYRSIIAYYEQLKKRDCLTDLLQKFPDVPEDTMESIIAQELQRKIQKTYWMHQNPKKVLQYYQDYQKATKAGKELGVLTKLADQAEIAPALMARLIIDHYYKEKHPNWSKSDLKEKVDEHYKNPLLMTNGRLAAEMMECFKEDYGYGPISESIKRCLGEEYESNLRKELKKLGVSFSQEPALRSSGFDKTPDIRLEVPIAVGDRIVNWIESKASFGDVERHKEYLVDQYARYKIRFGPGLVIYWFGFIDELNLYKRKNLFIMDHMPTDIKLMDPLKCIEIKTPLECLDHQQNIIKSREHELNHEDDMEKSTSKEEAETASYEKKSDIMEQN